MRRFLAALSVLAGVAALANAPAASAAAPVTGGAGAYVPVPLARVWNGESVGGHSTRSARVTGSSTGIPTSGVGAVAMTISVLSAKQSGSLVAYAAGATEPDTVTVQYGPGRRTSDLAVVIPGTNGSVSIHNNDDGAASVAIDVSGYYVSGASGSVKSYHPVKASRLYDDIAIAPGKQANPLLGGHGPLPGANIGAVAITLTERSASRYGALGAKAYQLPITGAKVLHWKAGERVSSFAIVPVDADGRLTLTNFSAGTVHVAVDVVGFYLQGSPFHAGMLNGVPGAAPLSNQAIGAGKTFNRLISGGSGVPQLATNVRAVVLTVTVTSPAGDPGSVLVWRYGKQRPDAASVQFGGGETASNTVVVPLDESRVSIYNHSGASVHVSLTVTGWVLDGTEDVPAPSASRYLNDLTMDSGHNATVMAKDARQDELSDPQLVLLDVGAQSRRMPTLSTQHPGVALALTDPTVRLTYPQLVSAVDAYVQAFANAGGTATIAVGTNNSGNFTDSSDPDNPIYPATARGDDWAKQVIDPIAASAPSDIPVIAADDIENGNPDTDGFDNSADRALTWEKHYLNHHVQATSTLPDLMYNGSANGCPTDFGTGTRATECSDGWTLSQFVQLTHNGSRIGVLPQIYHSYMAIQWADIDRISGRDLNFVGSLTEQSLAFSLPARQGWAALHNALATVVTAPSIPAAVDIEPAGPDKASLEHLRASA